MMKRETKLYVLVLLMIMYSDLLGWDHKLAHRAITLEATKNSVLGKKYFQLELSIGDGIDEESELPDGLESRISLRVANESNLKGRPDWRESIRLPLISWLVDGSMYEDTPNPRARHHFYDPIRNMGMDNRDDTNPLVQFQIRRGSKALYPNYRSLTLQGNGSVNTALGDDLRWWEPTPIGRNWCTWPAARLYFAAAIHAATEETRMKALASSLFVLGHICHLLEDAGVPAHARNDFVWGHLIAGLPWIEAEAEIDKDEIRDGGNPFEAWVENKVDENDGKIPDRWLAGMSNTIPAFDKISHYWDRQVCEETGAAQWQGHNQDWPNSGFGYSPPAASWGLAEASNYQFLSYSTVFKHNGTQQDYAHPARENVREYREDGGYRKHYLGGYGVPHLARVTYTSYMMSVFAPPMTIREDLVHCPEVFEDYAARTIPRTIDYASGLINSFFRGRLRVNAARTAGNRVILTIKNVSTNSSVGQVLHRGVFVLYWDNQQGIRRPIDTVDFGVYQPDSLTAAWNEQSELAHGQTTQAVLESHFLDTVARDFPGEQVKQYVLVFRGSISADPRDPDIHDAAAIAAKTFGIDHRPAYYVGGDIGVLYKLHDDGVSFEQDPCETRVGNLISSLHLTETQDIYLLAGGDGHKRMSVETTGERKVRKFTDDSLRVFGETDWGMHGNVVAPHGEIVDLAVDHSERVALAVLGYPSEPSDADMLLLSAAGHIDWTAKSESYAMARAYSCGFTALDVPLFGVVGGYYSSGFAGLRLDPTDGAVLARYWQATADNTFAHAMGATRDNTKIVIAATIDSTGVVSQFPMQGGSPDWVCELGPLWTPYHPPHLALLIHSNGDIYVCGDAGETTGTSVWKIGGAQGALLDTYRTGGQAKDIEEGYGQEIVVVGQTALNPDGQIVNVSVFNEDLYFLRGYDTPDSTLYAVGLVEDLPSIPRCHHPADGQTQVGVHGLLAWVPCIDADSYDVYVDGEFRGNQTHTSYDPGDLAYDTTYAWGILAHGENGCTSARWTFTTKAHEQVPDAPFYIAPLNLAQAVDIDTHLKWQSQPDAVSYNVYLDGEFRGNQTTTAFVPGSLPYDSEHTWTIESVNAANQVTRGATWVFNTAREVPTDLPASPVYLEPGDGGVVWGAQAVLAWDVQPDVTGYHVYLGPTSTGAVQVKENQAPVLPGPEAANIYEAADLLEDETYAWRVEAINASGVTSGPTWTFTVAAEPEE